jgi:hypothetical protein
MKRPLIHFTSGLASRMRPGVALARARRSVDAPTPPEHHLILYEYEASPWCRLIREYATILNLTIHVRPCPRQTLFLEGAYDHTSRFRPEAMNYLQKHRKLDDMTFPLLVDKTTSAENPVVIKHSYDILVHLWEQYGQSVIPNQPRPDKVWNSSRIPFPLRFLSLAAPSYFRAWPTCGLLQSPSTWTDENKELLLYQVEGCPDCRIVRETLCTLEIPYLSVPARNVPILIDGDAILEGADACCDHLRNQYRDPTRSLPTWWSMPLKEKNIGKSGSFGVGAYTAFVQGSRAFVPDQAFR